MHKVVFVSGSSRGIGYGILKKYASAGYAVIMSSVSGEEKAHVNLKALSVFDVPVHYVRCDIADAQSRVQALSAAADLHGRIDVLVNNAGVAPAVRKNILETTEESFDRVIDANLKGTFFMCQIFANKMIELKKKNLEDYSPRIVNIASISSYTSSPRRGEYCISKAGVSMVTSLFADVLAQYALPVFEVRPGIIKTDMTATVEEKYDKFIFEDNGLPLGRWGVPEDIASAVFALTSGAFDYSTGQVIDVDGGFHIRRL